MSVRFQCPHCKVVRTLNPRILGREIQCPDCNESVQLPTQEEIDAAKEKREAAKRSQAERAALEERRAAKAKKAMAATKEKPPEDDDHDDDDEPMFERRTMPPDHVDMTPMVDITFLLLIFFMSTANFTLQKSMEVPVKKKEDGSSKPVVKAVEVNDSVTVLVSELNGYTVRMGDGTERDAPSKQDLIIGLQDAKDSSPNMDPPSKLIVEAHRDCKHAAVVAALDAGRDKNFSTFQVNVVDNFD